MDARGKLHDIVDELCDLASEINDVENYATLKERAKVRFEEADKFWNELYEKLQKE